MKKHVTSAKNHVVRNRAKYTCLATTIVMLKLMNRNRAALEEFLKEHDLFDEYYLPED